MNFDEGQIAGFAIQKIKPDSVFSIGNTYESLTWNDESQTKPTKQEFNDAVTAWHKEWDAQEYARNRQAEFPSIKDLVVALYDTDDKSAVEAKRAAVKLKYPKPS